MLFCGWRKPVRAEHDPLSSKRKGPFDGFEIWDRARFVFTHPAAAEKPEVRSGPGCLSPQTPQDRWALISSSRRALIRPVSWRLKDGPSS